VNAAPAFALAGASVRFAAAPAPALSDATLSVRPGELVALVGPNGAGKTTALRALLGLVRLAAGSAEVFGRPSREWPREELARTVGVVAQREEPAFPVTVDETVAMGRYAHLGPWRAAGPADRAAVERALRRADVTHLAGRWVETLSGGEWQRVRLARALAQEPRALALDEPTTSLDLRHEMELFELVLDLVRADGLAALVVSHHLNMAARFADRLVLLADGRVVADGPPAQVLIAERLSETLGWPVSVLRLSDGAVHLVPERRPLTHSDGGPKP
jgi:iron complex transport system ATP-binding protein